MSPRAYGHTGFTGTSIAVDPDTGLFVVLLTNRVCPTRENGKLIRMRSLIHNAAAAAAERMRRRRRHGIDLPRRRTGRSSRLLQCICRQRNL